MKTAEELDLTEEEYEALKQVRCLLDTGNIPGENFDMAKMHDTNSCGTVACIGGWMSILMETEQPENLFSSGEKLDPKTDPNASCLFVMSHGPCHDLFYPNIMSKGTSWYDWERISLFSREHAVEAIDNFLETGYPKWREIYQRDIGPL